MKIFGPGNAYVTAAKKLLFGYVGIDLLSGPSELRPVAGVSAERAYCGGYVGASGAWQRLRRVWLVTTSERVLDATQAEIHEIQVGSLKRREFVQRALKNSGVFVMAKDIKQAVEIANRFAPGIAS